MRKIVLDARKMATKEIAHRYLKEVFDFPDYYGNNLDALWDELTGWTDIEIVIRHHQRLRENLGAYGEKLLEVFEELEKENLRVEVVLL